MADLTREDLWRQLKADRIAPVYLLSGPESFLRDRAVTEIINHSFTGADLRDFNQTEFSLNNKENIVTAISSARQLPMMSSRRVVTLTDVRIAATAFKDTLKEEYEELIADYLARPSDTSVLILIADELNGTRRLTKLLKKHAASVFFDRLGPGELTNWVRRAVRDAGCEIDDAGVRHLINLVGDDLRRFAAEIDKLATASLPSRIIDENLIDALAINSSEIENFALTSALISGNGPNALSVLKTILDGGAEPIALLGVMSYGFRRLMIAKEMMVRGDDRRAVSNQLGLRGRDQESFLAAARRIEGSTLSMVFERLRKADVAMKTSLGGGGTRGSRVQIEVLVCEIIASMNGIQTGSTSSARLK
jgi:DNA polymerase-3 subunit delta